MKLMMKRCWGNGDELSHHPGDGMRGQIPGSAMQLCKTPFWHGRGELTRPRKFSGRPFDRLPTLAAMRFHPRPYQHSNLMGLKRAILYRGRKQLNAMRCPQVSIEFRALYSRAFCSDPLQNYELRLISVLALEWNVSPTYYSEMALLHEMILMHEQFLNFASISCHHNQVHISSLLANVAACVSLLWNPYPCFPSQQI